MKKILHTSKYYDKYFEAYNYWSGQNGGGYHFGIATGIKDILNNNEMVKNASRFMISSLNLDFSKPLRILDAGCGSGQSDILCLEDFPSNNVKLFGITISKQQFSQAKNTAAKKGLNDRLFFSLNDFENLPFEDNYFDAIFFHDSICHGKGCSKKNAIKEAARVLKKEGSLSIIDGFINSKRENYIIKKIDKILRDSFNVDSWAEDILFRKELERNNFGEIKSKNLCWLIGPSVLNALCFKLPVIFWAYLRKKLEWNDLAFYLKVAIFSPILGLHPYFKYQLISAKKK